MARTATVRAKSKCLLAVLLKEDLQVQLQKYPDVAREILNEATDRYDALLKEMEKNGISAKSIDMVNIKKVYNTSDVANLSKYRHKITHFQA